MEVPFKFEIGQWVMLNSPEPIVQPTNLPSEEEPGIIIGAVGMVTHRMADQCIGGVQIYYNIRIGNYVYDYHKKAHTWHVAKDSLRFSEFELKAYNPTEHM